MGSLIQIHDSNLWGFISTNTTPIVIIHVPSSSHLHHDNFVSLLEGSKHRDNVFMLHAAM